LKRPDRAAALAEGRQAARAELELGLKLEEQLGELAAERTATVRRPLRPFGRRFLTEIYLCNVCSCLEILRAQRTRVGGCR
jgi:hypothetical protein